MEATIWAFYKDGELCGWTKDKKIRDQYKLERPNCKCKKLELDYYDEVNFYNLYRNYSLFENVMSDNDATIYPITSYAENDLLDNYLSHMNNEINDLLRALECTPIKKKYKNILRDALEKFVTNEVCEPMLNFDIISIYINKISTYFN